MHTKQGSLQRSADSLAAFKGGRFAAEIEGKGALGRDNGAGERRDHRSLLSPAPLSLPSAPFPSISAFITPYHQLLDTPLVAVIKDIPSELTFDFCFPGLRTTTFSLS